MKFEVNITKKYAFIFLFSVILIAGAVFVYAVAPNPGHEATQIGPGDFKGGYDSSWNFAGRVLVAGNNAYLPVLELVNIYAIAEKNRWRLIQNGKTLDIQAGTDAGFGKDNGITLLSMDGNTGDVKIGPSNLVLSRLQGLYPGSALNDEGVQVLSLSRFDGKGPYVNVNGRLSSKELCIDGKCQSSWDVQLANMPKGSWCGWKQGGTLTLCGDLDPYNDCPTGKEYTFTKRKIYIPVGEDGNPGSISTCVRTA